MEMRLIDANALKSKVFTSSSKAMNAQAKTACNNMIDKAPTIEIVRCKDCKYWQDNNDGYPHPDCRWTRIETPDADDYCSFGERSEE